MKKALLALLCCYTMNAQQSPPPTLTSCDTNGEGIGEFNLSEAESYLVNSCLPPNSDYSIFYFETLEDAQSFTNVISPENYNNSEPYNQTVYVKILSLQSYFLPINLVVNPRPLVPYVNLEIIDNYDDNPTDASLLVPFSVVSAPIVQANNTIEVEIKYFSDAALTTEVVFPLNITGGSYTMYYTASDLATGCWDVNIASLVVVDGVLSTHNNHFDIVKCYPNPVNNILTIDCSDELSSVSVVNSIGQTVYTSNTMKIDFSSFNSGIYYVTVSSVKGSKTLKIVKI